MPTTVTKTVKSAGGDYASLSAWEAGEQGDLVTLDEIHQAECYSFQDTTKVGISGWTTDATRYIRVYTPASERHAGVFTTSKYYLDTSGGHVIDLFDGDDDVKFEGIQIRHTQTASAAAQRGLLSRGGNTTISESIVLAVLSGTANPQAAIERNSGGDGSLKCRNVIIYDWINGTSAFAGFLCVAGTMFMDSCTAQNCYVGFYHFGGTVFARNDLAQNCTDGFNGTFTTANNNCSDIASDAPGTSPQTGSVSFVDAANDNFHLASGDTVAKDNGADLSGDANNPFSIDIDGVTRSGSWDIGADEASGAAATTTAPPPITSSGIFY